MKKIGILLSLILVLLTACTPKLSKEEEYDLLISNEIAVDTVYATYVFDNYHLENVIGYNDYVFIGKVSEYKETITNTPSGMPKTIYSVRVIENIKGNLIIDNDIEIYKGGGLSEDYKWKVMYEDDFFPEEEKYYIFFAYAIEDNNTYINGRNSNIFLPSGENYTRDDDYISCINAYENQIAFDRERYMSKYDVNYNEN
jgi:hypothetical protein